MNFYLIEMLISQNFHILGCKVFFYVPKQFLKSNITLFCQVYLVGMIPISPFTEFMILTLIKIILSRSVVFLEDIPGNCSSPSYPPNFLNFIPYYEIEEDKIRYFICYWKSF